MTSEVVSYMALNTDPARSLQFENIMQCAPFLKGLKTASILNVKRERICELYATIENTDISCRILAVRKRNYLVFFYRKDQLERKLSEADVREFLAGCGYAEETPGRILTRLSVRMGRYLREKNAFPHEIGVLLDYPLEDVKDFIRYGGRNCILTGYWKVYHNPEKARMTFFAYDKARDSAVNEFLAGQPFWKIAGRSAQRRTEACGSM